MQALNRYISDFGPNRSFWASKTRLDETLKLEPLEAFTSFRVSSERAEGVFQSSGGARVKMVKFLKANKAVVMLNGRYAGRKGVIVKSFDDGTRDRPYGHCLVVGISKYPKKVIRKDSAKKTAKKSRVKAFIKLVNYNHIMPTRYTLDVDLKDVVTTDALQSRDKKVTAAKEVKARFEERFKTGKNRWFFSKLRF
ncbi:hypothetical protein RJ640_004909 [Escallonia rubra]|uniref:60S ribosomal protein L27 n=3 Tax=Escallonia TaxID=23075 RepID=A0AA88RV28_9ASTE|nr:hypothetical protein RJ640_004909 [Escallonia rubra]